MVLVCDMVPLVCCIVLPSNCAKKSACAVENTINMRMRGKNRSIANQKNCTQFSSGFSKSVTSAIYTTHPHNCEPDMKKKKDHIDPEKEINTSVHSTSSAKHINYDLIQRMRFMNADQHITPEDSYTNGSRTFDD